jgi:hypothetical protein
MKNTLHIKNIDQAIEALEFIIDTSQRNGNTDGYFAALYHKVTVKVKEGIAQNYFDDGQRMEQLDVVFAKRYIDAWIDKTQGRRVSRSWKVAFDSAACFRLTVLQHLLLGMNVHINLDLGISAAQIMRGENMSSLHRDFNKINSVLASLVDQVQNNLATIWPTLGKLLKLSGKADDFLIDFSMKLARDGAWKFANQLALAEPNQFMPMVEQRDEKIAAKASLVLSPGLLPSMVFLIIRLSERGSVEKKITNLRQEGNL